MTNSERTINCVRRQTSYRLIKNRASRSTYLLPNTSQLVSLYKMVAGNIDCKIYVLQQLATRRIPWIHLNVREKEQMLFKLVDESADGVVTRFKN